MAVNIYLSNVKYALGITGSYQDNTLTVWINETVAFLKDAGVSDENITSGLVSRGVADLWNYGAGDGKFSTYFLQRATQLSYK